MDQFENPTVQGTELLSALFPVNPLENTAQLTANAKRELYVKGFPVSGPATFSRADKVPGLAAGDYGPTEEPGGETINLADDSPLYIPGASTFPRKTVVVHANDNHPKVKEMTAHAQTTKGSPKRGQPMAYQATNRDRSGEVGVFLVISRSTPKEGNHRHEFLVEYRSMDPYTSDQNPMSIDAQAPQVSGFTPAAGIPGDDLTATGSNLNTVTAVQFQQGNATVSGGEVTTFATQDADTLVFDAPDVPAGAYQLRFVNPSGATVATGDYTVSTT